ncbi:hypothetical protein NLX67_15045 [Domibacillus sp. A3M-37]|uniref:hypothetical protein n=1 Tax=Domibacillus sp. A3M-37 TaxID=2962037 RepID=UPI0020B89E18|nr:hypothetical protein [Domibacillus sp. A3M-37]MCP3763691.1 hypothetical protein [Domibacillus sp. A3M-37]
MSISMESALSILNEKEADIDINELGFILTVLRDNALDDDVYEVLNGAVQAAWEKSQRKSK